MGQNFLVHRLEVRMKVKRFFFFAFVCLLVSATGGFAAGNWRPLFNGKDMAGWEHIGPGSFTVENGMLVSHGGMGLLWYTKERFGNCVLRVVYKADPKANSGVFIQIPLPPKDPWDAVNSGYEVQILEESDYPSFNEYHRTGAMYSISKAGVYPPSADGWNAMEITMEGFQVVVRINGVTVSAWDPSDPVPPRKYWYEPQRGPRPEKGYIGVQNHNEESRVYFKEVSVKPLD
jgi:3-keto-disaccharide hydrolase